jgi:putative endonuclease
VKHWIYILKSKKNGSLYTGHSTDLDDRLRRHNSGECSHTKKFIPWEIIYREEVGTKSQAAKKELFYKSGAGRRVLKDLLKIS